MVQPVPEPLLVVFVVIILLQMEICLPQLQLKGSMVNVGKTKKKFRNQIVAMPQH
jgi:hypothetical protein